MVTKNPAGTPFCHLIRFFSGCLLLLICMPLTQAVVGLESLKAAYVYNIAKFVSWPQDETGVLTICLLSENVQLVEQFETLNGKPMGERVVEIRVLPKFVKLKDIHSCHILYNDNNQSRVLAAANRAPKILTITEQVAMEQLPGVVNFYVIDNKLLFEFDLELINKKQISISSKLLRLSNQIRQ